MKLLLIAGVLSLVSAQVPGVKTYGEYPEEPWDMKDVIAQNSDEEQYLKDGPGKGYTHAVNYSLG